MAYSKDENDTDAPSSGEDDDAQEQQGINPEDFDVPDVDEAALEAAMKDHPLPRGRQKVRIVGAILTATKTGDNEGRPQFLFTLGLADANDGEYDPCYLRIMPPWDRNGDAKGDVKLMYFPKRAARDLHDFEEKTGCKILGRNAADVLADAPGVEFDAIIKPRTWNRIKQAEVDRLC